MEKDRANRTEPVAENRSRLPRVAYGIPALSGTATGHNSALRPAPRLWASLYCMSFRPETFNLENTPCPSTLLSQLTFTTVTSSCFLEGIHVVQLNLHPSRARNHGPHSASLVTETRLCMATGMLKSRTQLVVPKAMLEGSKQTVGVMADFRGDQALTHCSNLEQ